MSNHIYRFTASWEAHDGTVLGEIETEVHYRFTPGTPARIRYDENDHPEEPAEVDIYDVKVEKFFGKTPRYVPTDSADQYELLLDYAMDHCYDDMVATAIEDREYERERAAEYTAEVRRDLREVFDE